MLIYDTTCQVGVMYASWHVHIIVNLLEMSLCVCGAQKYRLILFYFILFYFILFYFLSTLLFALP